MRLQIQSDVKQNKKAHRKSRQKIVSFKTNDLYLVSQKSAKNCMVFNSDYSLIMPRQMELNAEKKLLQQQQQ